MNIEDDVIDGFVVPKGTMVIIPLAAISRLPEFWGEDAAEFVPSRWLKDDSEKRDDESSGRAYMSMPFLIGPRWIL
jgi:cytochrome P450